MALVASRMTPPHPQDIMVTKWVDEDEIEVSYSMAFTVITSQLCWKPMIDFGVMLKWLFSSPPSSQHQLWENALEVQWSSCSSITPETCKFRPTEHECCAGCFWWPDTLLITLCGFVMENVTCLFLQKLCTRTWCFTAMQLIQACVWVVWLMCEKVCYRI